MDKYGVIKELGLQVFTKPLGPETMLVSADDLADVLSNTEHMYYSKFAEDTTYFNGATVKQLRININIKPKTKEDKMLAILDDDTLSPYTKLNEIRKLVDK